MSHTCALHFDRAEIMGQTAPLIARNLSCGAQNLGYSARIRKDTQEAALDGLVVGYPCPRG
ncbi:MAG: hypothetical protein P1P90_03315 [Patescibacteria group bacterium]|nr:hypothetical protein [Patescibacteria group bacterium]